MTADAVQSNAVNLLLLILCFFSEFRIQFYVLLSPYL